MRLLKEINLKQEAQAEVVEGDSEEDSPEGEAETLDSEEEGEDQEVIASRKVLSQLDHQEDHSETDQVIGFLAELKW